MSELTAMSDSLDGIMSEAQENAIFTTDGRKELAEQLTNVLIDN